MLAFVPIYPCPVLELAPMNRPTNETHEYTVQGMTCSHCVVSVREEVSAVAGVTAVAVDPDTGRLTISGENFNDQAVRTAVVEAGYEVAA
jgi:copper chaperone